MLRRDRPTRRSKADKLESQTTSLLPNSKTEQDDPYRSYEVNFKIPRCLTPYTEPGDYILEILGGITCNDDNGSDTIAGTVKGYIIQLDRIIKSRLWLKKIAQLPNCALIGRDLDFDASVVPRNMLFRSNTADPRSRDSSPTFSMREDALRRVGPAQTID